MCPQILEEVKALIRQFEGLQLSAYKCPAGIWTIGYGHTGADILPGQTISQKQADDLLNSDINRCSAQLLRLLREQRPSVQLSDPRQAALVSFIFNLGIASLRRSTLLKRILANPDDPRIASEFLRWSYANGRQLPGLLRRRQREAALYFSNPL